MMKMIAIMASVSASKYCRGTRAVNKCLRSYPIGGSLKPSIDYDLCGQESKFFYFIVQYCFLSCFNTSD